MLTSGQHVPCSNCGQGCHYGSTIGVRDTNPTNPDCSNVTHVYTVCSSKCKIEFEKRCAASAPYPLGSKGHDNCFIISFDAGTGLEFDFWTMWSHIPENGGWVICKCTDAGEIILDEKGSIIWRLVDHSLFQKSCPVYY
jgi:hypothetical protein